MQSSQTLEIELYTLYALRHYKLMNKKNLHNERHHKCRQTKELVSKQQERLSIHTVPCQDTSLLSQQYPQEEAK